RGPATAGRRVPAIAADMNPERQVQRLRAFIDRPVATPAERFIGARRDIDLHILADFGAALDLLDRGSGVVLADQDRRLQPRLAAAPMRELPFVDGPLDGRAEFEVLL